MRYLVPFLLLVAVSCSTYTAEVTRLGGAPAERKSISPEQVQLFSGAESVGCEVERIARVTAKHDPRASLSEVVEKTRPKAASQGANALINTPENDQTVVGHGETTFIAVYAPCL